MDINNLKAVIIVDAELPSGVITNTAAILGMSLGKKYPEIVGRNLINKDKEIHEGITIIGLPILSADKEKLKSIRDNAKQFENQIFEVNVLNLTRSTRSYEEYAEKLEQVANQDLEYQGILLYGEKKAINKLTGNLSLFK
ncbi:DUF2000 domain-containing protein [Acinetobacter soli]|uniref:DUF2000 domain-containing protein n=1 Tax=Acinetobacter soli TaxID=487316 RepID=UPI001250386B|nr:DUF2000 domain-containing protein [Acinetobacter soli]MDQ9833598.1 DUF2000 domain-containing protein [Acinetobacter soli]